MPLVGLLRELNAALAEQVARLEAENEQLRARAHGPL